MSFNFNIINLLLCFAVIELTCLTCASVLDQTCGKVKIGRPNIINGETAIRGAFPWVAVLIKNEDECFCGGTLLTKTKVLTAAHCIHGKDNQYEFTAQNITVLLGAYNLSKQHEIGRTPYGVQSIKIHTEWNTNSQSFDADIAMLTLTDDVHFTRFIQPICLIQPNSNIENILKGYAVGYGKSEDVTKNHENVLRFTETPINNDNEDCFYTEHSLLQLSSKRTFCGGTRNGSGVCVGDSGNGLFVADQNTYYIRGIVSSSLYTLDQCDVRNFAIFTNVIKFYDWINQNINDEGHLYRTTSRSKTSKIKTTRVSFTTSVPDSARFEYPKQFELPEISFTTVTPTFNFTTSTTQSTTTNEPTCYSGTSLDECDRWYSFCKLGF